jgi:hypothetical protein
MAGAALEKDAHKRDLSAQAVKRAVLAKSLVQPYVLYPTAIGLLGGLAAVLLGPSLIFVAPALAGTALGLGGWALDYGMRKDKHAAEYLRELHANLANRVESTIKELSGQFGKLRFEPGLEQLASLQERFTALQELLGRKLDSSEMTYGRYVGMTEQVYLAGLDNLRRVADAQRVLGGIDEDAIRERIRKLQADGIDSNAQDSEIATLEQRMKLRAERQEKMFAWLAENQQAITRIDQAMAAIADMDTQERHAGMQMEQAMQELGRLAARAADYTREE